jgi:hypothetical protein
MKKEKKVYLLVEWTSDTYAEYTVYDSRKEVYFNRPYDKTYYKAKKTYNWPWKYFDFWPHCEILTFANETHYTNGEDPICTKTYYK